MACLLAAAVAGCGGEDGPKEVEEVVRDFYAATSNSDGEAFCDLVTQDFRERITISQGGAARRECVSQIDRRQGAEVKVVDFVETKVEGDRATVRVELDVEGRPETRVLHLAREDGGFRLTDG